MNKLAKLFNGILDRVYPSDLYCISCGKIIDWSRTYRLCNDCMNEIKWGTEARCAKCGKRLSEFNPDTLCYNCREHSHDFDHGYACTEYDAHTRAIVFALKYDNRSDIAITIAEIMADYARIMPSYDLVVPVPITHRRRLARGYNQADIIAQEFAKRTGIRYEGEILERARETTAMKGLSPDERRRNIRGSFAAKTVNTNLINGARCLILDDIYTTGATIDEVATVLKECGASQVDFLSFASGADVVKS